MYLKFLKIIIFLFENDFENKANLFKKLLDVVVKEAT